MVIKSLTLFARSRVVCKGPDEFWRKRRVFRMAAHFDGRRRNCYSQAVRGVHRAMVNATLGRKLKKADMKLLWDTRLDAACQQHGIDQYKLRVGLTRCDILLDRKVLVDLAMWEPRTFKSLVNIALARIKIDGLNGIRHLDFPENVVTENLMKRPLGSPGTANHYNPHASVVTRHMLE